MNVQLKIHFSLFFYTNHIYLFSVAYAKLILTDLGKNSTDNALDQDQCPGKSELLLLVSLTVISSSAGKFRETTLCCIKHITDNGCKTEVASISFLGSWLNIGELYTGPQWITLQLTVQCGILLDYHPYYWLLSYCLLGWLHWLTCQYCSIIIYNTCKLLGCVKAMLQQSPVSSYLYETRCSLVTMKQHTICALTMCEMQEGALPLDHLPFVENHK